MRANLALGSLVLFASVLAYTQLHAVNHSPAQIQKVLAQSGAPSSQALHSALQHYQVLISGQQVCEQVDAAQFSSAFHTRRQQWQVEIKRQYLQAAWQLNQRKTRAANTTALHQALQALSQQGDAQNLAQFELPETWQNLPVDLAYVDQLRHSLQDLNPQQQHQRCDQLLAQASTPEFIAVEQSGF